MTLERIFIIGGTGNIGKALVTELLSKNVKLTLYARNPAKVTSLFPSGDIATVEGDLKNLEPLKDAVKGHTRLFFIVSDFALPMDHVKKTIATYAYEAGVQQIVDISSVTAGMGYKTSFIGHTHLLAEKAVSDIPNRGAFVVLRPGRFMSNSLTFDRVNPDGAIRDIQDPEEYLGWISTDDIGAVAAAVLTEDVKKHGDAVYELVGDRVTQNQRAEILSRLLNKKVTFQKVSVLDKYNKLIEFGFPHVIAYDLTCFSITAPQEGIVSSGFPILIGREPETLEEYYAKNKDSL